MNGSRPVVGGSGSDGGGLPNVTPSTVGVKDGLAVPPPTGGLDGPLAGHTLLLGVDVGNSMLAVNGTTSRLGSGDSGLGAAAGIATSLADGMPSARAPAARITGAPHRRLVLTANAAMKPSSEPERCGRGIVAILVILIVLLVVGRAPRLRRQKRGE